jgi:ankyrin repeat protein
MDAEEQAEQEVEEDGDCVVQVVGAFSDEILCKLQIPRASTVLHVKRYLQAAQGINVFRQRLVISPVGPQAEDHEVLAALPGLRLQLVRLQYVDDDQDGADRLIHAAHQGLALEVEQLLRLPLRPDCTTRAEDGVTALMTASGSGHLEVVRLLCEAGADKDKADQNGETALILASRRGHLEVARLLCEAGADKDKVDQYGDTALIRASIQDHPEVARLLCEAGADKDYTNEDGQTALMEASSYGLQDVARLLCEAGADKDKADHSGDTALWWASMNGHGDVARLLCEAGADMDHRCMVDWKGFVDWSQCLEP